MAKQKLYRWRVYHIRATPAEYIGSVDAPDAKTAVHSAIDLYQVPPNKRGRLIAVKVGRDAE